MSVFDNIPREEDDPRDHNERAFAYLNRSAREEAGRVRELVDAWFDRYPASHRDGLVSRFRSAIDDSHHSAFFELFLHEMILVRGHTVLEIEPRVPGTDRSPDFLVQAQEGHRFYLEAVMATGRSRQQEAAEARLNDLLTAIDNTNSPNHFLDLHVRGVPDRQLSSNKLRRLVTKWIDALPVGDGAKAAAPFVFEEAGVRIMLTAWPRRKPDAGARAIGVRHFPPRGVTVRTDIRDALAAKAGRYGQTDHPLVVAINAAERFSHEHDVIDALFGTEHATLSAANGRERMQSFRARDGVWMSAGGPSNKRLSAVLSTEGIDPWHLAIRQARLIRNPWAKNELPPVSLGIEELKLAGEQFERQPGKKFAEIFGLSEHWPEY